MKMSLRARIIASALAGTGFLAAFSPQAVARAEDLQAKHKFEIPAQALGTALLAFSDQAKVQVLMWAGTKGDAQSSGAVGELRSLDALTAILANTGLGFKQIDKETVAIVKPDGTTKPVSQNSQFDGAAAAFKVAQANSGQSSSSSSENTQNSQNQSTASLPSSEGRENESKLDEVVVTGTHIRGSTSIGSPITTIDSIQIAQSGYTTTEQLLQSLPQNFRGGGAGASADANFASGTNTAYNETAGSGINLRGLGNTATLVLVNGHRVASSGGGFFTDISTIPVSAIDHIDVLTDGASAIYGSDAIAGVVNIILKDEGHGLDTGVRYGSANGFSTNGGNAQIGSQWARGGGTVGADFSHQGLLDSSQRSFTSTFHSPTSIIPSYTQTAVSAAIHQELGDRFEVHSDAQYTKKDGTNYFGSTTSYKDSTTIDRWSAALGGSYRISNSWIFHYDVSGGEEWNRTTAQTFSPGSPLTLYSIADFISKFTDHNASFAGNLFDLPAGTVKLALGAAYRSEYYSENGNFSFSQNGTDIYHVSRSVRGGYGELRIPVFSELNAVPGISKLTLLGAGRIDDYSDFGHTTNPKVGISWFPVASLEFRGAYSTSFRAPATGVELNSARLGTAVIFLEPFPNADKSAQVPMAILLGGRPNLKPETATNVTIGLDWKPSYVPGLQASLNYYDISYKNQLAVPPFSAAPLSDPVVAPVITTYPSSAPVQALVNTAVANGALLFDYTGGAFGPNPLPRTLYTYDFRTANLSTTKTSGFDVDTRYGFAVGKDHVDTSVDITYIDKFVTQLTADAPETSEVNTVGFPARLRVRASAAWTHGPLNAFFAVNLIDSYPDTSSSMPRDVASYTTLDLTARYEFPYRIVASIAAANVLNQLPPYVVSGGAFRGPGSHYDAANANPIGRIVNFQIAKQW